MPAAHAGERLRSLAVCQNLPVLDVVLGLYLCYISPACPEAAHGRAFVLAALEKA